MKLLLRLLALGFTLLTAGLLAAVYLLSAPQGLQWSYRLAAILLPGKLSIEHLEGRLLGPLALSGVHYQNDNVDLRITQLDLQWQPGALVEGKLQIDSLNVTGLHMLSAPSPAATNALPDIRLPLTVHIDQATVRDLNLSERGKSTAFALTEASLTNAEFDKGRLQLQRLAVTAPRYQLTVTGNLTPQRAYTMDLAVQWSADGGDYGPLAGRAQITGDLRQLNIRHQLTAPVQAELRGTITDPLNELGWQAELNVPEIKLQALRAQWPALTLGGTARGKGNLHRLQAEGELRSGYQTLQADHRFAVVYEKNVLKLNRFDTRFPESGARVDLHGTLSLGQAPQGAFAGTWQGLRWPLQGESKIHSNAGRFDIAGTIDRYKAHIDADLAGAHLPPSDWSISADGTPQKVIITQAAGRLLGGTLTASGEFGWQPRLHWQAAIQGSDLNPGAQWPDWPGRIAFAAQSSGNISDGAVQLQLDLSRVQGELKSFPIDADGALAVQGDHYRLGKLRIDSGGNHFTAVGDLQDDWDLQWQITAADLAHLLPGGAGRLQGSGNISGPRAAPLFTATLAGQQLNIAGNRIGAIDLIMALDTQGRVPSTLDIQARDATFGKYSMESIRLRGDGTAQHHQAQILVASADSKLALELKGRYLRQQWRGAVEGFDLDASAAGRWRLAAPAQFLLDRTAAHLDELCLRQAAARVCATAQWNAASGWQTQGTARAVPLSLIKDWFPSGTSLAGHLDADAVAAADAAALITGKVDARITAGMVSPALPGKDDSSEPVIYHQARITAALDEKSLTAQVVADFADSGGIHGSLLVDRGAMPTPFGAGETSRDNAVKGRLQGDVKDLSLLPVLIPGVEHTHGHLFTTLSIAGSWDNPRVSGELRLENGAAAIPTLGLNPDDIDLVARGDEHGHLRLDAQLRSKDGSLRLGGDLYFDPASGFNIQAQLTGDRAEIVNTPEFHILASPNIHLGLHGHRIDLDGEIFIPEANLRPKDVSGAVSASNDVVIISTEGPAAPQDRWQIYSQLRVRLGDFVKFSGFGLKGLLVGDFTLNDAPRQPTVARGELRITNGEYRAYGQKLEIDRGRLLFFGGPVDNPGLDIRAVRHIQEVTAGILVRGTLKAPQVQLFSEPAMAETDALSYLLTGQPINQATSAQGQQLYGAALSLGLAGSGLLANQIGQRFGIDEVTVESGGNFGGGALVIRHYLSPKIYISYGVGLMEHLNIFLMRYQISRRWSLEAGSGAQSGADMVYTLERE